MLVQDFFDPQHFTDRYPKRKIIYKTIDTYIYTYEYGDFQKWGYPKLDGFYWKILFKMDDLEVPPF